LIAELGACPSSGVQVAASLIHCWVMSKNFRPWKIDEVQLLPASVQDYVPKEHLSRLIVVLVREALDLSMISGSYLSAFGQPPFDPRLMTALLLHGYASGIYSSRRIAKAAVERADFMMIVAGDPPDFRTISEFRRRHLQALAALFVQVLQLAEKAGLVKLGHVALDGTKIKANASKHKAMSYERMSRREAELAAEVERWLAAAAAADAQEDALYGDKRGDEMPDWVADKEQRLAKIRAAKAELEAEAKAAAEEEEAARQRAAAETKRLAEGRQKNGRAPAPPKTEPDGKAQRNFTDPLIIDDRLLVICPWALRTFAHHWARLAFIGSGLPTIFPISLKVCATKTRLTFRSVVFYSALRERESEPTNLMFIIRDVISFSNSPPRIANSNNVRMALSSPFIALSKRVRTTASPFVTERLESPSWIMILSLTT
jgi:transposase